MTLKMETRAQVILKTTILLGRRRPEKSATVTRRYTKLYSELSP